MKNLVITADDFGIARDVNEAIINCIENGMVSSTNVMVNMPYFYEAKKINHDSVSVGIHWNITTGKSVLPSSEIPTLVDKDGKFYSLLVLKKRIRQRKTKLRDIKKELHAQYELFVKTLGYEPCYWNSHENSSLIFRLIFIYLKVAKKCNIKATRNFMRHYIDFKNVPLRRKIREYFVRAVVNIIFGVLYKLNFKMPRKRIISFYQSSKTDLNLIISSFAKKRKFLIEYVCHPSTTADNEYFGVYSQSRVDEYNFLNGQKFKSALFDNDIKIVNFRDL